MSLKEKRLNGCIKYYMMKKTGIFILLLLCFACSKKESSFGVPSVDQGNLEKGCANTNYPNWENSLHMLPYPVGKSYTIGLSHCSGEEHSEGLPDQFAIDIIMTVGTLVTASRKGTIMFVEESGMDYEFPNNMVILRDEDGYFLQYQNLTHNGALVSVGQFVEIGDPIGLSGASGGARYPHLHFVATDSNWQYPYTSYPITFKNTSENPYSLIEGKTYTALSD